MPAQLNFRSEQTGVKLDVQLDGPGLYPTEKLEEKVINNFSSVQFNLVYI